MSAVEGKILTPAALAERREELRAAGRKVVHCHGCFDIVHPGHIRYLRFAREQGDVLIVSVSGDSVVGKGPDRPYINEDLRMENLAALEAVDYVCLDEHDWGGPILETLQPDVYVKGKEYESNQDPRFAREREIVEGYGGKVIFSSGEVVYSSTFILSQFRERFRLEHERIRFFCRRHAIDHRAIDDLLRSMRGQRMLVFGDPILDRYVHCDALSVAAESPILSVSPIREDWYLGAGALIARQILAFGGEAALLTPLADDRWGRRFREGLETAGVEVIPVAEDDRPTYVKTRYLVEDKKVFKVNEGRYAPLSSTAKKSLAERLERHLPDYDGLLVTDFGYGLFSPEVVEIVLQAAEKAGKPYFVDVSQIGQANVLKFRRPRLATPTEEELRFAFADKESGLSNLASRYYSETGAEQLVITMGKRGVVIFDPPEEKGARLASDYLPAFAENPLDTIGAGDVFLTTVAMACLAGAPTTRGLYLASAAAAVHMQRLGNEPVDLIDLESYLERRDELSQAAGREEGG